MTQINYGVSASISRDFGHKTVGQLIRDPKILGALDAPEGCSAVSNGRVLSENSYIKDVPHLTLEKRAASKANA
tara:strand:+ start:443 stop:664 length:222 start_codon:yes stop_codon:yes gene_type:complete